MNDEKTTTREAEGQQRKRNSFVFYRSFVEAAGLLEQQERKSLIDAVISYGLDGVEPTFESMAVKVAWVLIKPQLDANWKKYENGRKGAPFGKMGGAPIGNTNASKTTPKQPQNNPKTTPNVNVNANVNANANGLCSIKEQKPHNIESGGAFLKNAPAIDKIREYIEAGGLDVDADEFFEHYEANGWKTKDGKPITNWRGLLRSWDKRKRQPDSDAGTHDEAEPDSEADSKPTGGTSGADQGWEAFQGWARQNLPEDLRLHIGRSDYEWMLFRTNGYTPLMAEALERLADASEWLPIYAEYDKALEAVKHDKKTTPGVTRETWEQFKVWAAANVPNVSKNITPKIFGFLYAKAHQDLERVFRILMRIEEEGRYDTASLKKEFIINLEKGSGRKEAEK